MNKKFYTSRRQRSQKIFMTEFGIPFHQHELQDHDECEVVFRLSNVDHSKQIDAVFMGPTLMTYEIVKND